MSQAYFVEFQSQREITGGNFQKGLISYKIDNGKLINLSKSYFKLRIKLTDQNDVQLTRSANIGPNLFLGDSLFQSMQICSANNIEVESIDDYVHQIGALRNRMDHSSAWLNNIGKTFILSQPKLQDRVDLISSDGLDNNDFGFSQIHPGNPLSTISYTPPLNTLSIAQLNAQATGGSLLNVLDSIQLIAVGETARWTDQAGGDLDIRNIYRVGDIVNYIDGGGFTGNFIISLFIDGLNANITKDQVIANSASTAIGIGHIVIRHSNPYENGGQLVGLNTLFQTELSTGDKILNNNNKEEYTVVTISDNFNITVFPPPTKLFIATANWFKLSKSQASQSRRVSEFELMYQPCFGMWKVDKFLCCPWYIKFFSTEQSSFKKYAIESLVDKTSGDDFEFEVVDMVFYGYCMDENNVSDGVKELNIDTVRCKSRNINTASKSDLLYNVDPNLHMITIAYQDSESSNNSSLSRGKFKIQGNTDLNLNSLYVNFDGKKLPNPNYNPEFSTGKDFTTQMFYEELAYSGQLYKSDIVDIQTWQEYGPYYNFRFGNNNSRDDRLVVSQSFTSLNGRIPNLLCFDWTMKHVKLFVKNGRIVNVKVD